MVEHKGTGDIWNVVMPDSMHDAERKLHVREAAGMRTLCGITADSWALYYGRRSLTWIMKRGDRCKECVRRVYEQEERRDAAARAAGDTDPR